MVRRNNVRKWGELYAVEVREWCGGEKDHDQEQALHGVQGQA